MLLLCLLLIRCDSLTLRVTYLCRAHRDLRGIDAGDDEGRTLFDESAFALDLDGASANLRVADEGQTGQGHATLADDDGELVGIERRSRVFERAAHHMANTMRTIERARLSSEAHRP